MNPVCKKIHTTKRYIMTAFATLLLLVALYMYFLSSSILHVVAQKEVSQMISDTNSAIATLESDYIAAQHAVSERVATLPNLFATSEKIFVDRSDTALVVRDNINLIAP